MEELRKYDEGLYHKPRWLVLNKMDMVPEEERAEVQARFLSELGWDGPCFTLSALTGEGCRELTYRIMDYLEENRRPDDEASQEEGAP